ncbi:Uncharacterised nucleotidyltransferase [Paenibacillus sp. UNC496MF]|uniref:nucleotidyltransferase domain-containing protein n=1 Tax=Paenibacillus sp. UNC496MF TaxID=1502753 RepID=UPI0008E7CB30|nr:nucleotidyltransferase family protein [Paenibacillus sp. UNC496MF]SFI88949.1 Uncharacterised nucleotidyltransferase [Paenibacillus sp. UNC496MF]
MADTGDMEGESLPKELSFLLGLLREEEEPDLDGIDDRGPDPALDWNAVLYLAQHHRIYPTVYERLSRLEGNRVPEAVGREFEALYRLNTFHMLHLSGEMERVCAAFAERSVRCLQLKGPILAGELYGDLSRRTSKDLDMLVYERELEQAERVLAELGYVSEEEPAVLNSRKRVSHHASYWNDERGVQIEIHWKLNGYGMPEPGFEALWERRRRSERSGDPVYFLGPEDLFLHLVTHGARHGWFRLRWLTDLDRLARQGLDWKGLLPHLRRYDAEHLAGQAFLLMFRLFRTPVPQETAPITCSRQGERLAEAAFELIRTPLDPRVNLKFERYLLAFLPWRQRLRYVAALLYPSAKDARAVPLPKPLHVLYFGLRPMLLVWRLLRGGERSDAA